MHGLVVVPQNLLRESFGIACKARNLRKRLSSYRVANPPSCQRYGRAGPERLPRRIIRLLHRVTRIEFDICPTEEAARNRAELLICVLNPRFNGAGKVWPRQQRCLFSGVNVGCDGRGGSPSHRSLNALGHFGR
jgi:hypothetical protein